MSILQKIVIVIFTFALLSACTFQEAQYKYVRPTDSRIGKKCITQCLVGKYSCEQLCILKNPSCEIKAEQNAAYDYAAYQQQQRVLGKPSKKRLKDFLNDDSCRHACHCTQAYNTCYTACGGQVFPL